MLFLLEKAGGIHQPGLVFFFEASMTQGFFPDFGAPEVCALE